VAECNLGEVKLEPMQAAVVRGKPWAGGFAFTGFVAGAFVLRSSYVLVRLCLLWLSAFFAPSP